MAIRLTFELFNRKASLHSKLLFDPVLVCPFLAVGNSSVSHQHNLYRKSRRMEVVEKRSQPEWKAPEGVEVPRLKLYNSLTRQKTEFKPMM